jgi:hypothetical protein
VGAFAKAAGHSLPMRKRFLNDAMKQYQYYRGPSSVSSWRDRQNAAALMVMKV